MHAFFTALLGIVAIVWTAEFVILARGVPSIPASAEVGVGVGIVANGTPPQLRIVWVGSIWMDQSAVPGLVQGLAYGPTSVGVVSVQLV